MTSADKRPLRVFLCHSSNDKTAVRELYQKLRAELWIQPWLDEEELYPGQDWNMEIEKAVEAADAIIVCLSKGSITKEGYVQKEIRAALDYADYKPEGTLFIIPVRLEECQPPKRLGRWQYADYFEGQRERGLQRLLVSLKRRADSLGLITVKTLTRTGEKSLFSPVINFEANPKHEPLSPVLDSKREYINALSVAHLEVPQYFHGERRSSSYSGTAWMIAPGLAITCAHVLKARSPFEDLNELDFKEQWSDALLTFEYLLPGSGIQYRILSLEHHNEDLDFSLLRLNERKTVPANKWGYLKLTSSDAPLTMQTPLVIIQHPLGQHGQIATGNLAPIAAHPDMIFFDAAPEQGTSGAPILNRQNWEVIGIYQGENNNVGFRQGRLIYSILDYLKVNQPILHQEIYEAQQNWRLLI